MMTLDVEVVRENWAIVQERIRLASVRGGWDHKVNVVAATKYVDLDDMDILIQAGIKVVGENRAEESKYGILPGDAEAFLERAAPYETVRFVGLMTMAPLAEDAEETRPVFRGLRALRDDLASRFSSRYALKELSMGMSNDYQVAVEEGATLVRLGSVLFTRA